VLGITLINFWARDHIDLHLISPQNLQRQTLFWIDGFSAP
jgi:hypothetical protein